MTLAGGMAVWPLVVRAQQQPMPVIGYVAASTVKRSERLLASVREGMSEYGYVEGRNFRFELREANYQNDLLPALYRTLVDQKVRLIIADSTVKLESARAATQSIPIIFLIGTDPVENGFVASLNKPGGNVTGTFNFTGMLAAKQVEILHELVPSAAKLAFLTDPGNPTFGDLATRHIQAAAASFELGLQNVNADTPDEFETAFEAAVRGGAGGMIVGADPIFVTGFTQLVVLAARSQLVLFKKTIR
jgi:putative ABC transport system substrate-binding protein